MHLLQDLLYFGHFLRVLLKHLFHFIIQGLYVFFDSFYLLQMRLIIPFNLFLGDREKVFSYGWHGLKGNICMGFFLWFGSTNHDDHRKLVSKHLLRLNFGVFKVKNRSILINIISLVRSNIRIRLADNGNQKIQEAN